MPVINPATGEPFAEAPSCSRAQLDAAMASAQAARPTGVGTERRRDALRRAAEVMFAAPRSWRPSSPPSRGSRSATPPWSSSVPGPGSSTSQSSSSPTRCCRTTSRPGPHRAPAHGSRRGDHAVELPDRARGHEARPSAPRREHRRPEAVALHAVQQPAPGRGAPLGAPAGRPERRVRRGRARPVDDGAPGAPKDRVHGFGGHGQGGGPLGVERSEADDPRARWERRCDRPRRRGRRRRRRAAASVPRS